MALFAIAIAYVPHSSSIVLFYACGTIIGLGAGVLDCVLTVWTIEMWKDKSAPILQASGFLYGVGTITGPLIVEPFVTGKYS